MNESPPSYKMYDYIKSHCDLAVIYARDGAYHSAARVLFQVFEETKKHAIEVDLREREGMK